MKEIKVGKINLYVAKKKKNVIGKKKKEKKTYVQCKKSNTRFFTFIRYFYLILKLIN